MDKSVEVLHDEYIISGETYLFCIDNDLQTLEDVAGCFADGTAVCSARVRSEVESILNLYAPQPSVNEEEFQSLNGQPHSEGCQQAYLRLKELCSVRAKNALNSVECQLGFPSEEFWGFLMDKGNRIYNFKHIRNVGRKTVDELLDLADKLETISEEVVVPKQTQNDPVSEATSQGDDLNDNKQLDLFEFAVEQEMNNLSVRSKNALLRQLNLHGNSILELCKALNNPNLNLLTIKNVGKGTVSELQVFIKRIGELWDIHQSPEGRMKQSRSIRVNALQKNFGLTEPEAQAIIEEFPDADTPPLFRMIDSMMRRDHRNWIIMSSCLNIFKGQTIRNSQDTAEKLGLSRERVRQLRNKLYASICDMIRAWGSSKGEYDFSHYLDYSRMEYNDQHIDRLNKEEKVYFNSNFVYRVLSLFFHEQYILVGNDFRAFTETGNDGLNIFIVSKELSDIFNFTAMLDDMRLKFNSKVYEDYEIELNQYLLQFFYDDIFFDKIPELLELCCKIIHRIFGIVAINDTLVIEKNATKPLPELVECNNRLN